MNNVTALKRAIKKFKNQQAFADRMGVSQGLVSHWLRNRVLLTPYRCQQIEIVTDGAVTMESLRPDWFRPARSRKTKRPARRIHE